MGVTPRDRLGMTSSFVSVVRTVGRSTGIAILGAFWVSLVLVYAGAGFADAPTAPIPAQVIGTQQAFWLAGAFVLGHRPAAHRMGLAARAARTRKQSPNLIIPQSQTQNRDREITRLSGRHQWRGSHLCESRLGLFCS